MNQNSAFLSNALTNFIKSKYTIDPNLDQLLQIGVISFISNLQYVADSVNVNTLSNLSIGIKLFLIPLIGLVSNNIKYMILLVFIKFVYDKYYKIQKDNSINKILKSTTIDNVNDDVVTEPVYQVIDVSNIKSKIISLYKFIKLHPEFFDNSVSYRFIEYDDEVFPIYNEPLQFYDKIHNISGIINTEYTFKINTKNEVMHNFIFKMSIKKGDNHFKCYVTQLINYVQSQSKFGDVVELNYYKIMNNSLVIHNYYNNHIEKWVDECNSIEDGYFSNHKKFIFSIMKQKSNYDINSSNNWNNLILEGPPGTGKSSLIYRIAVLMKRNIISLDLTLYLDKKKELYAIFHGNDFKLPDDDNKVYNIHSNIIVLEEFDNTIMKLVELEKIYQLKIDLIDKFQENKRKALTSQMSKTEFKSKKTIEEAANSDSGNYLTSCKESIDNSRKFDTNLHTINGDVDNIIKIHKEFHKSDVLRLGDLLELFQGSVPIKDRMIIATTNHFKKIKTFLPALFRNGRMTPLSFEYLDWESFTELCEFYFNDKPFSSEFKIIIPTSQLIELALKIQSVNGDVNDFELEVQNNQSKKNEEEVNEEEVNQEEVDDGQSPDVSDMRSSQHSICPAKQDDKKNINNIKEEILKQLSNNNQVKGIEENINDDMLSNLLY